MPIGEAATANIMRIVHVVRQFPPSVGGIEEVVAQLAAAQAAAGHTVGVVTLDRVFAEPARVLPAHDTMGAVRITRIPYRGSSRYPLAPQALAHVRDADLVHVHAIDFFFDFLAAAAPLHRRPLVATTHGGFFHTPAHARLKRWWFSAITRRAARAYGALIACSQADEDLFRPLGHRRLRLIENGVDIAKFADRGAQTPHKRAIAIGRFSVNKRLDRVLDATAALVARDGDWRVTIAGAESDWTAARLHSEIAARGLDSIVTAIVRPTNAALAEAIGTASVFLSASDHEGFGVSLIEAMSAGLAPVVAGNAAFRAFSKRHADVALADYADPAAAAAVICARHAQVCADALLRARLMAAAAGYAWPDVARRTLALYEDVMRAE